jgi:hypothetical protein
MFNYNTLTNKELTTVCTDMNIPYDEDNIVRAELIKELKARGGHPDYENKQNELEKHRIYLHNQGPGIDSEPVFVSVLGKDWLIPRETEVDVPAEVVRVLENAIETRWFRVKGVDGSEVYEPKDMRRFAFTVKYEPLKK